MDLNKIIFVWSPTYFSCKRLWIWISPSAWQGGLLMKMQEHLMQTHQETTRINNAQRR